MSTTNQVPEEVRPETAAAVSPAPEKKTGGPKTQNALLRYITILFAVAFLVVLLSLVISNQQTQNTITALNQTSASALENAEQLQEMNRELSDANAALQEQINQLELELEQANEDKAQAREDAQAAETAAEETAKAYELLLTAMDARQNGDPEAFDAAMMALEPMQELLSDAAVDCYNELVRVWE